MSIVSEQTWYVQSSQRPTGAPRNNFEIANLQTFIRVNTNQTIKFKLVSFNTLNAFYNISDQNNSFTLSGIKCYLKTGFYTDFSNICNNISATLNPVISSISVTVEPFTNRGIWTWPTSGDVYSTYTISFDYGRNSHALMGFPFNFGENYTITGTIVGSNYVFKTPSPMVYNYLQNINLRANFPLLQNIEWKNASGTLDVSQLFAKIPVIAAPYENIWFNAQDTEQYISQAMGTGSAISVINFQITDDYQNLLTCYYDWEATIKIEVIEEKLNNLLDKAMLGTDDHGNKFSYFGALPDIANNIHTTNNMIEGAFTNSHNWKTEYSLNPKLDVSQLKDPTISVTKGTWATLDLSIATAGGAMAAALATGMGASAAALGTGLDATAAALATGMESTAGAIGTGMTEVAGAVTGVAGEVTAALEASTAATDTTIGGLIEAQTAVMEEYVAFATATEKEKALTRIERWAKTVKSYSDVLAFVTKFIEAVNRTEQAYKDTRDFFKKITDATHADAVQLDSDVTTAGKLISDSLDNAKNEIQQLNNLIFTFGNSAHLDFDAIKTSINTGSADIATKIDIDLSKLDLDLSQLDLDLGKLDIDLGDLKTIASALDKLDSLKDIKDELAKVGVDLGELKSIKDIVTALNKMGIDVAKLDDLKNLKDISEHFETLDGEVDFPSVVAQLKDISEHFETLDGKVDFPSIVAQLKGGVNIWTVISSSFNQLVKHITGHASEASKTTYDTEIAELQKLISEANKPEVKEDAQRWVSENKSLKFDPQRSDTKSYNKMISTAITLENKIHLEPLERWITKHQERTGFTETTPENKTRLAKVQKK